VRVKEVKRHEKDADIRADALFHRFPGGLGAYRRLDDRRRRGVDRTRAQYHRLLLPREGLGTLGSGAARRRAPIPAGLKRNRHRRDPHFYARKTENVVSVIRLWNDLHVFISPGFLVDQMSAAWSKTHVYKNAVVACIEDSTALPVLVLQVFVT